MMKTRRMRIGWQLLAVLLIALLVTVGLDQGLSVVKAQEDRKVDTSRLGKIAPAPVLSRPVQTNRDDSAFGFSSAPFQEKRQTTSIPDSLPVSPTPEFRLPPQIALSPQVKQASAQQPAVTPAPLSEMDGPALLHSLRGPVDVFVSSTEIEKGKPYLIRVTFTGMQELGGKRFLTFQRIEIGEEIWLLDATQIAAVRCRR